MEKFNKSFLIFFLVSTLTSSFSFSSSPAISPYLSADDQVLFTVSEEPVYLEEFNYVYNKSNGRQDDAYTEESLQEYLDLYINFRLKIKEAMDLQMDTSKAFKNELAKYRSQAAQPYLTSKETIEALMKEAYERMQTDVRASHILIKVAPGAEPADTLAAYNRINGLRDKVLAGEDFGQLAMESSEDPSAATNGGDLGYFTAFAMVYPFETMTYNTDVGAVSPIFRSDFGFHFLKVTDKRPNQGKVKVAHIMIRSTEGMDQDEAQAAEAKIQEIYKELQNGADWGKMVNEYSEDGYSKVKDGELDPISVNSRIVPSFKEVALSMSKEGELSEPFQSPYGWHIIKFISKEDLKSYEELEAEIKKSVERDGRSKMQKDALAKKLKMENSYKEFPKTLDWLSTQVDTTIMSGKFQAPENDKKYKKNLFTLNGKDGFNCYDYLDYLKLKRPSTPMKPAYFTKFFFNDYVKNSVIKYEEDHLEDKYYDFKMLMQEYHDGILMFNLMEEKIWNESTRDTVGLDAYFENNQADFQWGQRADAWVFDCKDQATLDIVNKEVEAGKFSVLRPTPATYYYDYRAKELAEKDENGLVTRLKILNSNQDFRAVVSTYSYSKESYGSYAKLNMQRIEALKTKLEEMDIPMEAIEFVDAGTKNSGTDLEKARRVTCEFYSLNPKELQTKLNKENPLSLNIRKGKFEKGDNEYVDQVEWKEGDYVVKNEDRVVKVKIFGTEDPRPKKLDEVKGEAISGYQDFLEEEWIKELKAKYPVSVNEEVFQTLIKTNP